MNNELNVFFQEHTLSSYSVALTKALSAKGVNINLFTIKRKLKKQGVNVKYFPLSKLMWGLGRKIINGCMYSWLLKNIENSNVRVFHINVASNSEIFLEAGERYRIPMVYTNHYVLESEPLESLDAESSIYKKEKLLTPFICENSFKVVTVSQYAKRRLKEEFEINSDVIYHGVDLSVFNPSVSRVYRKLLDVQNDEGIVLWVARFGHHPYKDPFAFIRAIPLVLRDYPKTKFVMIGKGFLKRYAINLAKKLSLSRSLVFFDYVENLNYFYASSDVFVLSSFNDNFGLVVAEAMACGKPVIVSNRGAPKEVVGDAGLTFEYGCPSDLADKIIMLLENEDLREKLAVKAHKRIVENFTWEKAAEKYLEIYNKTIYH